MRPGVNSLSVSFMGKVALDALHIKMFHAVPKSEGSRNYIPGDFVNNNDILKSTSPTDTRFWSDKYQPIVHGIQYIAFF